MLLSGLSVSIPGLEKSLHQYTLEPSEKPFDMKTVPLATTPITEQKTGTTTQLLTNQNRVSLDFPTQLSNYHTSGGSVKDVFLLPEIAPVATSKLPEKLAPSRQDIYQGMFVNTICPLRLAWCNWRQMLAFMSIIPAWLDIMNKMPTMYLFLSVSAFRPSDRATGVHPRVPGSGPALQVFWASAADGGWDRIRGALRQTHFRQAHGVPVRLHKHSEWPALAEGTSSCSAYFHAHFYFTMLFFCFVFFPRRIS